MCWPTALQHVLRTIKTGQDLEPEKLIVWLRMLAPNAANAAEIATFTRQNPDWPLPTLMERRRQEAIAAERDNATAAAVCLYASARAQRPVS